MREVLYWAFVNGAKELAISLEEAQERIKEGDGEDAIKIIDGVIEELTGEIRRNK